MCRVTGGEPALIPSDEVDYMDISARQMVFVGTAMIPFLEHDDANRALMEVTCNVKLFLCWTVQAPLVGTGMERRAAIDAGDVLISKLPVLLQKYQLIT